MSLDSTSANARWRPLVFKNFVPTLPDRCIVTRGPLPATHKGLDPGPHRLRSTHIYQPVDRLFITPKPMKFYQARSGYNAMTNNTYYDDKHRTVYKVNTPFKITNRTSTITKMLDPQPEVVPPTSDEENIDLVDLDSEEGQSSGLGMQRRGSAKSTTSIIDPDQKSGDWKDSSMQEMPPGGELNFGRPRYGQAFEYLAQIDWRYLTSSKFRFGDGMEVLSKDFLRKEGWGPYEKHRVFTAKDGKEYKWLLDWWESELIRNDGSKTQVARFNRKSLGVIGKASPAYLEIFPPGEHMVDEIFVTFVYIEKLRKDQENGDT